MKGLNPIEKGEYGYIDNRKKRLLVLSILSLTVVLIIFLTGLIIYHTNKSIYAVIAAVASLPAAKLLTLYLVIIKYKTGSLDIYEFISKKAEESFAKYVCDIVIASESKNSYIQFAYVVDGKIYLYTDYAKIDISFAEKYIKKILDDNCNYSSVKIYTDKEKYLSAVKKSSSLEETSHMDERICNRLLAYSM